MKEQFYFLTMAFLMITHLSWGQTDCSTVSLEDFVDLQFELNYETGEFNWTGSAVGNPPLPYSSYNYNFTVSVDSDAVGGNGGSGDNPQGSTTFSPFDGSVDVGVLCVDGVLTCANCDATPMAVNVAFTFTLGDCNFMGSASVAIDQNQCGGGSGITINDDRQVGNTIENLGDGRLSALNADGTVIAFSSAGGYYVCELIGETWTPIGGEITTASSVTQIFISGDGNSVFVNLAEGNSPQCSYRSGSSFTSNKLSQTGSDVPVSRIWDVTSDGSYILFQIDSSSIGVTSRSSACGSINSGGMISTQVNINQVTNIFNGTIIGGYLSDDGQNYCVVDGERSQTAFYSVTGQEINTFSGIVISASGDLTSCLVITDVNSGAGYISVWDGASTFYTSATSDYRGTASYSFSSSGSTCIGLNSQGQLVTATSISVVNEMVVAQAEQFVVEGIGTYSGVSLSGNGSRLGGFGRNGDFMSDLFIFEFNQEREERNIDDERQIGNTIRDLGDGRVSVLNDDGTVIAFSSSGGYYVCELINETWTLIGGEITTVNPVSEIFISADGSSVFVNLSNGSTSQCSYRNGDSFTTNTLSEPGNPARVTRIWDVNGNGSYILYRAVFSEDGDETISTSCGSIQSGGQITTQVNANILTGISGGMITRGFVSDNGAYFCVVDGGNNRTAFYRVTGTGTGEEVSTFTGQVTSASRDLTSCLVITDQTTQTGVITVWDGGVIFTSSEADDYSNNNSYDFSADGSTCVGTDTDGGLVTARISVVDDEVIIDEDEFIVEEIPNFRRVTVSGDGNRITFPDGDGGDRPDLFVFRFGNSMMPIDSTDTDMDGIPDIVDQDDDNDGILDSQECLSAVDYSETVFGPSQITILTSRGDVVNISVGSMVTDDALFGIGFPNSFNLDRGADNTNRFVMDFPFEIYSLKITAIDFDSDAFGDPTEWMDDFSIFPTRVTGDGRAVADGFTFGSTNQQTLVGQGIIPDTLNGVMELFWDNLPVGTTSISWNNRRTTMDLDINFQIDGICIDTDGDGIPNEKDPDSDGDGCLDVEEAGHADNDEDGVLGISPITVDNSGLVTGQGGYTGITDDVIMVNDGCEVKDCIVLEEVREGQTASCQDPSSVSTIVVITSERIDESYSTSVFDPSGAATTTDITQDDSNIMLIRGDFNSGLHQLVISQADGECSIDTTIMLSGRVDDNGEPCPEEECTEIAASIFALQPATCDKPTTEFAFATDPPLLVGFDVIIEGPSEVEVRTTDNGEQILSSGIGQILDPGSYTFTFTNPNGCTGAVSIEIAAAVDENGNECPGDGMDDCDNDAEGPVLTCVGDITVTAAEFDSGFDTGTATATDNCPGEVSVSFEDITTAESDCGRVISRQWIAVDIAGNSSATCVQTITVVNSEYISSSGYGCTNPESSNYNPNAICDDGSCIFEGCDDCTDGIGPVFEGVEVFIVGECGEISIEDLGITATDNCGGEVTITFEEFNFSPSCLGSLQRTYTATDNCGNSTEAVQIIDLTNENGPIIDCPVDATYACIEDVPEATEPDVSHGCGLDVTVEFSETSEVDGCTTTIRREWTATDECGGVTTCAQIITVVDNDAPVPPTGIEDITVQCASDVPVAPVLTADDNCGTVEGILLEDVIPGSCPSSFMVTRLWSFTDECGNTSELSQTITVEDTISPVPPQAPADITVQCADNIPAAATLTASDNCNGFVDGVASDTRVDGSCENNFTVTRTWTFTDDCGNTSDVSQTITVEDTTDPVPPVAPANIVVDCAANIPSAETLMATDNCNEEIAGVVTDQRTDGDCPNSFTITRTWTFTDRCDNVSSINQTIRVEDTQAPDPDTAPEAITVQCAADIPAAATLIGTDNCDGMIEGIVSDERTDGDCDNRFTVTRTWTFTDLCSNTSQATQMITVADTIRPIVIDGPISISVQCAENVPAPADLTAEDNCSGLITSSPTDVITPGNCDNSFMITRSWVFTDDCGNSTTLIQTIDVNDTEAPAPPVAPADVTVQCADDLPAPADLSAFDACQGFVVGISSDVRTDGSCDNTFDITRTWTFTDDCGNTSSISQLIRVQDTTPPVAPAAPEGILVQCATDVPDPATLMATDNCDGEITGAAVDTRTDGPCANTFDITRTWTFTDDCGNMSQVSQMIRVQDTTAPEAPSAPADVIVECADEVPGPVTLVASDNCDDVITGTAVNTRTDGPCANSFEITRTWTFTDECGNTSMTSQTIRVQDTTPPAPPVAPAPITIACADDIPTPAELSAFDACDGFVMGVSSDVRTDGPCANTFDITRTWTFTDECGNTSEVDQMISVEDVTAPIVPAVPATLNVQCEDDIEPAVELTTVDNCGATTIGALTEVQSDRDCPNSFEVLRTWTFTDACGNSSIATQTVIVRDTEAPTFLVEPEDFTVECRDELGEQEDPPATDNCQVPTVTCEEVENLDECGNGTITITCTAVDDCGNSTSLTQVVTINDMTPPVLIGIPEEESFDCDADIPEEPMVTATDNCEGEVDINFTEVINGGQPIVCELSQPAEPVCHDDENWAMVLFDLPVGEFFSNINATFSEFSDGTAHITGQVSDNRDPASGGFIIEARFENKMNWAEWSSQDFPTSFKDECGTGNHESWTYYILSEGSTITGYGQFAGTVLTLTHAPVNRFFGYQVGLGANNVNESLGNGGWFIAQGDVVVNGETFANITTAGDLAFDGDCCTSYEVVRTWTATDCSGNTSEEATQTITFEGRTMGVNDDSPSVQLTEDALSTNDISYESIGDDIAITSLAPNPTSHQTSIGYILNESTRVLIEVIDRNGYLVHKVYQNNAIAGLEYNQIIDTDNMPNGVYIIRVNSGKEVAYTKLVVTK